MQKKFYLKNFCAWILLQNVVFTHSVVQSRKVRSPLQPYSSRCLTVSHVILIVWCHPDEEQSYKDCINTTQF